MAVDQNGNYVPKCLDASGDLSYLPCAVLPGVQWVDNEHAQRDIDNGETSELGNFWHRQGAAPATRRSRLPKASSPTSASEPTDARYRLRLNPARISTAAPNP